MDGGGDGDAGEVDEVVAGQHRELLQHQRQQLLAQRLVGAVGQLHLRRAAVPQLHQDLGEQVFLAREVVVQRAFGDLGGGGHLVHAGGLEAMGAELDLDLRGRSLLPVHNGTFDLAMHAWDDPFERIVELAGAQGVPVITPMMGETVALRQPRRGDAWWRALREPQPSSEPSAKLGVDLGAAEQVPVIRR